MRDTRNFKWMCILVIREVSSLSPLQFISVIRKQTLPYQAETQDRHQVAVESCVILREEETHTQIMCIYIRHILFPALPSDGRHVSYSLRAPDLTGLLPVASAGDVEEDFEDLYDPLRGLQ